MPCREAGPSCEQERHVLMAPEPQASAGDKLNSATVFIAINPEFFPYRNFELEKKVLERRRVKDGCFGNRNVFFYLPFKTCTLRKDGGTQGT